MPGRMPCRASSLEVEAANMIGMGLVRAVVQLDPSMGVILFVGGLILLAGVLYFFVKYTD